MLALNVYAAIPGVIGDGCALDAADTLPPNKACSSGAYVGVIELGTSCKQCAHHHKVLVKALG